MENQKQQLKYETNYTYVRANVFSKNFEPIDKFSAGILANIKKINEEKDKTSGGTKKISIIPKKDVNNLMKSTK